MKRMIQPLTLFLLVTTAYQPLLAQKPDSRSITAALEETVGDAIQAASESVVAISRFKKREGTSTTNAVRDKAVQADPRQIPNNAGFIANQFEDVQSFDYAAGVVIGENGEMVTTFHSIQGADRIAVRAAGRLQFDAEIIAADPRSDLAIIMPTRASLDALKIRLKPLKIGQAEKIRRGSFLVALGNPFNAALDGQPSSAFGILSNNARRLDLTLDETTSTGRQLRHLPTLMQLDSKLNLGMSGGAVVNMNGELVGITTTGGNPQGFDAQAGYAIPMDILGRRAISTLIRGEEVEYGFLGVSLATNGSNVIQGVSPGTPAARAGLIQGDQIVKIGEIPVTDGDQLVLAVNSFPVETPLKITYRRTLFNEAKPAPLVEAQLRLAKFPVGGEVIATNKPQPWRGLEVDYPSVMIQGNPLGELPTLRSIPPDSDGVIVTHINAGSPALGLMKPGELITSVNGQRINGPRQFRQIVKDLKGPVRIKTQDAEFELNDTPDNSVKP